MTDTAAYGPQNEAKLRRALDIAAGPQSAPGIALTPAAPDLVLTAPNDQARRRTQQIELAEQCAYFAAVNKCLHPAALADGRFVALPGYPGADMIYAVPNSNVAGRNVGARLVRSGLRRGYPDINVDAPRGRYSGLRIELKRPAGVRSDVERHQVDWHERLRDQGYRVCVCFGWREAWDLTKEYLGWEL